VNPVVARVVARPLCETEYQGTAYQSPGESQVTNEDRPLPKFQQGLPRALGGGQTQQIGVVFAIAYVIVKLVDLFSAARPRSDR
jgi:hypothetical protein